MTPKCRDEKITPSLFNLSLFCSSVSPLSLLWSSSWSSLHLFAGFLLHNQQFALSSVVSLCLCLCLCYQSKRVPSLLSKKKLSVSLYYIFEDCESVKLKHLQKLSDLLLIFVLLRVLSFLLDLIITSYRCTQDSSEKLKQKETTRTSKTGHGS